MATRKSKGSPLPRSVVLPDPGWRPVPSGARAVARFCSPACGAGCSLRAYDAAVRNAAVTASTLGPAWRPEVREAGGWRAYAVAADGRWRVRVDVLTLSGSGEPALGYTAWYDEEASVTGFHTQHSGQRWRSTRRDPVSALRDALRKAWAEAEALRRVVDGAWRDAGVRVPPRSAP